MAVNQRWMRTAWSRWRREKSWHTARVAHGPGEIGGVDDGGASGRVARLLRRPSRFPLVLAGALLDLLGLAALAAYVVLALFGIFALSGLGHALPAFPGDQTASLRVVLIPVSAALVELLEPLRALLKGAG
jgi:hypothetical protein